MLKGERIKPFTFSFYTYHQKLILYLSSCPQSGRLHHKNQSVNTGGVHFCPVCSSFKGWCVHRLNCINVVVPRNTYRCGCRPEVLIVGKIHPCRALHCIVKFSRALCPERVLPHINGRRLAPLFGVALWSLQITWEGGMPYADHRIIHSNHCIMRDLL